MPLKNKNIIYLLGSGRSGTTLLAAILNSTPEVNAFGELHQFYTHLNSNLECSCDNKLTDCEFWTKVLSHLQITENELNRFVIKQNREEEHKFIPLLLLGKKASKDYITSQENLFHSITNFKNNWILDSSKYVGRFLLLKQIKNLNLKGIYVVRDIRGVINSFNKQVQTPKKPINAIFYYLFTNTFAQLVCWLNKDVVKLRYEDLVDNPLNEVDKIYTSLLNSKKNMFNLNEVFDIPHIIGGNRLKSRKSITIKKDIAWKQNITRTNQIIYYLLCFPFMLINRYKI